LYVTNPSRLPLWTGLVKCSHSQGLATASGGRSWARYASIYSETTLYNYAVSGAVCSNDVTPRLFSAINASFPDIAGYEVPAFLADANYTSPNGTRFFTGTPASTAYAIWIGTNDLGNNAFLTNSQVAGKTVADYTDCVYSTVATLRAHGATHFVLLNLAPLNLLPQYALPSAGGRNVTQYFPANGRNLTDTSFRMQQTVAALNQVYAYRSAVEATGGGITIANFDVHGLMTDVYQNPAEYLNGSLPLNVTGVVNQCDATGANCVRSSSPDSFMWYDELHPSEQTSRVVAKEFVAVLDGESKWATYWG
jgi:phospholipase/lecithinase/hemolysin